MHAAASLCSDFPTPANIHAATSTHKCTYLVGVAVSASKPIVCNSLVRGIGRASDKVIGLVLCIHHWRCHLRGTRAGDSSCCSILRGDFGLPSRLAALCMRNAALGEIVLAAFSNSKTPPSDNVLLLLSFPVLLATKLQPTKSPSSRTQMP